MMLLFVVTALLSGGCLSAPIHDGGDTPPALTDTCERNCIWTGVGLSNYCSDLFDYPSFCQYPETFHNCQATCTAILEADVKDDSESNDQGQTSSTTTTAAPKTTTQITTLALHTTLAQHAEPKSTTAPKTTSTPTKKAVTKTTSTPKATAPPNTTSSKTTSAPITTEGQRMTTSTNTASPAPKATPSTTTASISTTKAPGNASSNNTTATGTVKSSSALIDICKKDCLWIGSRTTRTCDVLNDNELGVDLCDDSRTFDNCKATCTRILLQELSGKSNYTTQSPKATSMPTVTIKVPTTTEFAATPSLTDKCQKPCVWAADGLFGTCKDLVNNTQDVDLCNNPRNFENCEATCTGILQQALSAEDSTTRTVASTATSQRMTPSLTDKCQEPCVWAADGLFGTCKELLNNPLGVDLCNEPRTFENCQATCTGILQQANSQRSEEEQADSTITTGSSTALTTKMPQTTTETSPEKSTPSLTDKCQKSCVWVGDGLYYTCKDIPYNTLGTDLCNNPQTFENCEAKCTGILQQMSKKTQEGGATSNNPDSQSPSSNNPDSQSPSSNNPDSQSPSSNNPDSQSPSSNNPDSQSPSSNSPGSQSVSSNNPDSSTLSSNNPDSPVLSSNSRDGPALLLSELVDDVKPEYRTIVEDIFNFMKYLRRSLGDFRDYEISER